MDAADETSCAPECSHRSWTTCIHRGNDSLRGDTRKDYESLRTAALRLLDENRRDGGRSTLPAQGQYPHQWNWDSAFIAARACGSWTPPCALQELESLFAGQSETAWSRQIVYRPYELPKARLPGELAGTRSVPPKSGRLRESGRRASPNPPWPPSPRKYIARAQTRVRRR